MANIIESTIRLDDKASESIKQITTSLADVTKKFNEVGKASTPSGAAVTSALDSIVDAAAATFSIQKMIGFVQSAIAESTQMSESIRHLAGQLDAQGMSFDKNSEQIKTWVESMQRVAHVQDDVVYEALNRTVKRVGNLTTSMQLVQLAQDIVIKQGGDFNNVLNMLSMAAGGTQRGVAMLNREFGQQVKNAKDANEAINILQKNYGGASKNVDTLTTSIANSRIKFDGLKKSIGNDLVPAFKGLTDNAINPTIAALIKLRSYTTIPSAKLTEGVREVVDKIKSTWELMQRNPAALMDISELKGKFVDVQTNLDKLKLSLGEGLKVKPIIVPPGAAEEKQLQELLKRQLELHRANESLVLSNKFASEEAKIQAITERAAEEEKITWSLGASTKQSYQETSDQVVAIEQNAQQQITQIRLQGSERWRVALADYGRAVVDVNNNMVDIGIQAFDGLGNAAGNAFGRMLVEGTSFTRGFKAAFKSLATSVLSDISAMIVKMLVLRTIASIAGTSIFGFVPFAEGGRITSPTLALLGEGGEPETVVPDSKARRFASNVLQRSSNGTGVSGNTFVIQVNASNSAGTIPELIEAARSGTAQAIEAALLMNRLASANDSRA